MILTLESLFFLYTNMLLTFFPSRQQMMLSRFYIVI